MSLAGFGGLAIAASIAQLHAGAPFLDMFQVADGKEWAALVYAAVMCSWLAYTAMSFANQYLDATVTTAYCIVQPVVTMSVVAVCCDTPWSENLPGSTHAALCGSRASWGQVGGAGLILAGLACVSHVPGRPRDQAPQRTM